MTPASHLADLVREATRRTPGATAIVDGPRHVTYAELDALADGFARRLAARGVVQGDRVGLWLEKSAPTIAAMQGVLRLGAAYVPIDPLLPPLRARAIATDCAMRAVVTTTPRAESLALDPSVALLDVDVALDEPGASIATPASTLDDLAYILYTSGSTGMPKGVCISHRNALAFIEWAATEVVATGADRCSSHAPFHFDLSVLDLYVPFLTGGSVALIGEDTAYAARGLVEFIRREGITIWYSVPSALMIMMDHGHLLDEPPGALRAILFAGEPFPIRHLARLRAAWPAPRLLNLYGPTETNVCTFYEAGDDVATRTKPIPIGRACSGDVVRALRPDGTEAAIGEEGELFVTGPTVMLGYWGRPPQGDRAYATGDVVRQDADGTYEYVGRRDHQVKVRGYRIELGDIEAALLLHPLIGEAAVVVQGAGNEARLVAFLSAKQERPTFLAVKRHCAEHLPRYMIVHDVTFVDALPRTRNGKIDRAELQRTLAPAPR